jgi:hypothetical protein
MSSTDGTTNVCGSSTWSDNFVPLTFTIPHYGQAMTVKVTASLDQATTDESWGLADVRIESSLDDCTSTVYSSSFSNDGADGWTITGALLGDEVTICGECVAGAIHSSKLPSPHPDPPPPSARPV